jgi:predicted dehydrogenase
VRWNVKKILMIGAGGISKRHADVISRIEEIEVAGVCDIDRDRAEALAARLESVAYTDMDDALVRSNPDYVVLLTPRTVREPVVERCARAGLPIFMEKPPCRSTSVGRRIESILRDANLLHTVAFMHRWNDALNTVLDKISGQRVSTINVSFQSNFGTIPWWGYCPDPYLVEVTGGLAGDQGIHYIDACRYITNSEVRSITAVGANQMLPISEHVTTRDTAAWMLEMENGAIVSHCHTWCAPEWGCKIELVTDKSIVTVDMFGNSAKGKISGEDFDYTGTLDEFEAEHRGFLRAVEAGDMSIVRSPYADALETFRVTAEVNRLLYGRTDELI